jgi:riboflavin kinase / FMN adenylyltransferase
MGFELAPVSPILGRAGRVSSTAIRGMIAAGRASRACRCMGAYFALEGPVVHGYGIGSKQTVPTLNLAPENELLPGNGVYVTRTRDESTQSEWRSITNVGYRPTFDGREQTIETFLLDPPPPEAPARIEVSFLAFVREERKFETPEALKAQIFRDVGAAKRFHRRLALLRVG